MFIWKRHYTGIDIAETKRVLGFDLWLNRHSHDHKVTYARLCFTLRKILLNLGVRREYGVAGYSWILWCWFYSLRMPTLFWMIEKSSWGMRTGRDGPGAYIVMHLGRVGFYFEEPKWLTARRHRKYAEDMEQLFRDHPEQDCGDDGEIDDPNQYC